MTTQSGDDTEDPVASGRAVDARWVGTSDLLCGESSAAAPNTLDVIEAALDFIGDTDEPVQIV